jgi:hypothetical protein
MQIKATNWLPTDEVDACNGDLVVAITEVIVGHTILAENLFGLNPKTLENCWKRMGLLPFLFPADATRRKKERGPRRGGGRARSRQVAAFLVHYLTTSSTST